MRNILYPDDNQNSKSSTPSNSELEGKLLYNISVPQAGIVAYGLLKSTDLADWAILSYINRWESNNKAKKITKCGNVFVWINYNKLIDSLPILKIRSKDGISKRIQKLKVLNLIEKYQANDNTLYLRLSDLCRSVLDFHTKGDEAFLPESDSCPTEVGQPYIPEIRQPCPTRIGQHNNISLKNNLDNKSNKVGYAKKACNPNSKNGKVPNQHPRRDLNTLSNKPPHWQRETETKGVGYSARGYSPPMAEDTKSIKALRVLKQKMNSDIKAFPQNRGAVYTDPKFFIFSGVPQLIPISSSGARGTT